MFLQIEPESRKSLNRPVARELTLRRIPDKPAAQPAPTTPTKPATPPKPAPTIEIHSAGVDMKAVPLKDLSPELIRALLGDRRSLSINDHTPATPPPAR